MENNKKPENQTIVQGWTLRDEFAKSAMQELIKYYYSTEKFLENIPLESYKLADAMLKQRNQ